MADALRWAIVPAAGRGRRLAPATDAVPKVLLPVGLRPMIDWAVDEALAAEADSIVVIVAPDQGAVRRHVERRAQGDDWPDGIDLRLVVQPEPRGLGEALLRCRPLTGDDAFAVVVPDNWFEAATPPVSHLVETHTRSGLDTIGLIEVMPPQAARLGNVGRVDLEALDGRGEDFRILALADKRPGSFEMAGEEPVLRGCARYVLGPSFYDALEAVGAPADGEWDDVPAFQHLIATRGLAGRRLVATHFDVGQPAGYLAAMSHLLEREKGRA